MRVADRDGERVGRISTLRLRCRQQHADHHLHLLLAGMAGADTDFLIRFAGYS
jgi:hypothetical protein